MAIVHQTIDGVRSGLRKQRSEKKSCREGERAGLSDQHAVERAGAAYRGREGLLSGHLVRRAEFACGE